MRRAGVITLAVVVASCTVSVPDDAISVLDAREMIVEHNGASATIHGWLGECYSLDCPIYSSEVFARAGSADDWETEEWQTARDHSLLLYVDSDFQSIASWMEFDEVVVQGKLDASCRAPEGETMCFDGADFRPDTIEKVIF